MVRCTFSPARAWRPTVVARLARTLGSAMQVLQCSSRVSACRRELNTHEAAKPQGIGLLSPQDQGSRSIPPLRANDALCPHIKDKELLWQLVGLLCVGTLGFQPVCRAAAPTSSRQSTGRCRRLEHLERSRSQRGAGDALCAPARATGPWQAHLRGKHRAALPNPSLKRSPNGGPPGPCGAVGYPAPHGPGVPPLAPA